ncbi:MAG TPA: membrane dipeptidase, partial [Puia sp.]|nr:membrane dipeptidase [Puia sp.]
MFTVDAHLDLSMNALEWNRDLRKPISEINGREKGMKDKPDRGNALVSLPDLRNGDIGLVVATLIGRYVAPDNPLPGWHSPEQAWAQIQGQLAWYNEMEEEGEMLQVNDLSTLKDFLATRKTGQKTIGYILSLEGADSIVTLGHLERMYRLGLRAIGPAHYGPGRYANG